MIYLFIGLLIGSFISLLIYRLFVDKKYVNKDKFDEIFSENSYLKYENEIRLTQDQIDQKYISKEFYGIITDNLNKANEDIKQLNNALNEKQEKILQLTIELGDKISKAELLANYVYKNQYDLINSTLIDLRQKLAVEKDTSESRQNQILLLTAESKEKLTKDEVESGYVRKESFDIINGKLNNAEIKINYQTNEILELTKQLEKLRGEEEHLNDKINSFNTKFKEIQEANRNELKNFANEILEEKKKSFVDTSKSELTHILDPLKADLNNFKKTVEETRGKDIEDLTSLKKEIDTLQKLNTQLSGDAQNLAHALKSEVKVQGDWGEDRLKLILETEGLEQYIDYKAQESYKDDELKINRRPDFILNLPEDKHLIIDSKVSLTAYVNYFNASDLAQKNSFLKDHVKSITDHIDNLADKNYQSLTGINTPDYVFLFVPIEGALTLALNLNQEIFNRALKKKIVLITPTTLVSCLKIVKIIWKNANQVKNVEKIFNEFGALYGKFAEFVKSMDKVRTGLDTANTNFREAMNHLTDGKRSGSTLIGRFETIKELGANVKNGKSIPQKYLDEIGWDSSSEEDSQAEEASKIE